MSGENDRKVLLIGWDAADWKVASPLIDEGRMPNLEKLIDTGVMGNIATLYPVLSPMLWTSIATGKRAYKHGVHGFAEPDPRTGTVRPITNLSRKCKAVWNILNQNGKKCNVVGWWPSHPAEPLNGVMVSNRFQQIRASQDKPWTLPPGIVHPKRIHAPLKKHRIHPAELEAAQILSFPKPPRSIRTKTRDWAPWPKSCPRMSAYTRRQRPSCSWSHGISWRSTSTASTTSVTAS